MRFGGLALGILAFGMPYVHQILRLSFREIEGAALAIETSSKVLVTALLLGSLYVLLRRPNVWNAIGIVLGFLGFAILLGPYLLSLLI